MLDIIKVGRGVATPLYPLATYLNRLGGRLVGCFFTWLKAFIWFAIPVKKTPKPLRTTDIVVHKSLSNIYLPPFYTLHIAQMC